MIKTSRRMWICSVLVALNLLFIWGNSLLPGTLSSLVSRFVGDVMEFLFHIPVNETQGGGHLIRKLAHFSEYACLGMLLCWLTAMMGERGFRMGATPAFLALGAACVDETIQLFADGRASSLKDVWFDTAGAVAGIGLLLFAHYLTKAKKTYFRRKLQ